jgi:hypothetical protein
MGFTEEIVPNPDWGNPTPNVNPDEWNDDEETIEVDDDGYDEDFE